MKKIITLVLVLTLAFTSIFSIGVCAKKKRPTIKITFDFRGGTQGYGDKKHTAYSASGYASVKAPNEKKEFYDIKKFQYWFGGFYTKKKGGEFVGVYGNQLKRAKKKTTYYAHWVRAPKYTWSRIRFKNGEIKIKGKRKYITTKTHGEGGVLASITYPKNKNDVYSYEKNFGRGEKINAGFGKAFINNIFNKKLKEYKKTHDIRIGLHKVDITCTFKVFLETKDSCGYNTRHTSVQKIKITRHF